MFGIGTGELIIIAAVAAIVLGPERCVRAARQAGRLLRQVRAEWANAKDRIDEHLS